VIWSGAGSSVLHVKPCIIIRDLVREPLNVTQAFNQDGDTTTRAPGVEC